MAFRGEATRLIVSLQTAVPPPKNKGKGKGSTSLVPSIADGEDLSEKAIVSELELEYDENASIDESDASGSEFQVSEDDFENAEEEEFIVKSRKTPRKQSILITDEDFFNNDSDEEVMLDAAIHESLQTARLDNASRNGVSSSSRASVSSNPAAVLRAAAAERRLARANQVIDVDDFQVIDVDELSTLTESDAQSSSDEEALSKAKGKGKSKTPKKSATVYDTISIKFMSITQRRKLNREQRKLAAASRRENRKEELAMIKQLGRPLTHVRLKISANNVSSGLIYTGRKIDDRASQATRRTQKCLGRSRKEHTNCRTPNGRTAGESKRHSTSVSAREFALDEAAGARSLAWWNVGGMSVLYLKFIILILGASLCCSSGRDGVSSLYCTAS